MYTVSPMCFQQKLLSDDNCIIVIGDWNLFERNLKLLFQNGQVTTIFIEIMSRIFEGLDKFCGKPKYPHVQEAFADKIRKKKSSTYSKKKIQY